MAQSCKTCRFLDVRPDAAGRRVARKGSVHPCLYPLPSFPALPDSVTKNWQFRLPSDATKVFMEKTDGTACPTYERLSTKAAA